VARAVVLQTVVARIVEEGPIFGTNFGGPVLGSLSE
jgi:hypothetical protein